MPFFRGWVDGGPVEARGGGGEANQHAGQVGGGTRSKEATARSDGEALPEPREARGGDRPAPARRWVLTRRPAGPGRVRARPRPVVGSKQSTQLLTETAVKLISSGIPHPAARQAPPAAQRVGGAPKPRPWPLRRCSGDSPPQRPSPRPGRRRQRHAGDCPAPTTGASRFRPLVPRPSFQGLGVWDSESHTWLGPFLRLHSHRHSPGWLL